MIDATGAGAATLAQNADRTRATEALERQAAALTAVGRRVNAAIADADAAAHAEWHGSARRLYDIALAALASALALAVPSLDEALAETSRAIATLSELR